MGERGLSWKDEFASCLSGVVLSDVVGSCPLRALRPEQLFDISQSDVPKLSLFLSADDYSSCGQVSLPTTRQGISLP